MKNLEYIFKPESIAVIGATPEKGKIGHELLHNLISYEFNGKVFPVNPKHSVIHSIKSYSTVLDVPDRVDCAVIVVPRQYVGGVVDQCGSKGVKGLIVITSGFREVGASGAVLEEELLEKVKKYDMRMIGPNCFGVINASPAVSMDATFSKVRPNIWQNRFCLAVGRYGRGYYGSGHQHESGFFILCFNRQ